MATKKNPNASLYGTQKVRAALPAQKAAPGARPSSQKPGPEQLAEIPRHAPTPEERKRFIDASELSAELLDDLADAYLYLRRRSNAPRPSGGDLLSLLSAWAKLAPPKQRARAHLLILDIRASQLKSANMPRIDRPQTGPGRPDYALRFAELCVDYEYSAKQAAIAEDLAVRTADEFRQADPETRLYSESARSATKRWKEREVKVLAEQEARRKRRKPSVSPQK